MVNFDRYGSVKVDNGVITKFEEKKFYKKAYINCGVYVMSKNIFKKIETLDKFSFEEFLETNLSNIKACSYISNDSYFLDIGIPDDYEKAKIDFKEIF
jgi:D-glycero-alpha-D-manno-heptose 1-phosphate guanylyltransferase